MYLSATDEATKKQYEASFLQVQTLMNTMNTKAESEEFENLIVSAANDLRNEIPAIVSAVNAKNPNAKIIIQTIYNPYNNMKIEFPQIATVDLEAIGERSVAGMNEVIKELSSANGYTVADVWTSFEGLSLKAVNADWDLMKQVIEYDPHPNEFGHAVIADVYYGLIKENVSEK